MGHRGGVPLCDPAGDQGHALSPKTPTPPTYSCSPFNDACTSRDIAVDLSGFACKAKPSNINMLPECDRAEQITTLNIKFAKSASILYGEFVSERSAFQNKMILL